MESRSTLCRVTVIDCYFERNDADTGGAIFVGVNTTLAFRGLNNYLLAQRANLRGGAILVMGHVEFESPTEIVDSYAGINGGGIFVTSTGSIGQLENVQFAGNTPNDYHGI